MVGRLLGQPTNTAVGRAAVLRLALAASWNGSRRSPGRSHLISEESAAIVTANIVCRSDKAMRELGYRPASVETMLKDCIDWMVAENLITPKDGSPLVSSGFATAPARREMENRLNIRLMTRSYRRGGISRLIRALKPSRPGQIDVGSVFVRWPSRSVAAAAEAVSAFPRDISAPIMPLISSSNGVCT